MQGLSTVIDAGVSTTQPHIVRRQPQRAATVRRATDIRLGLLQAIAQLHTCYEFATACHQLSVHLQQQLGEGQVLLGIASPAGRCRLVALSGIEDFDSQGEFVRAAEAVMNLHAGSGSSGANAVEQQLLQVAGASRVLTLPLERPDGRGMAGKLIVLSNEPADPDVLHQIDSLSTLIAANLQNAQPTRARLWERLRRIVGQDARAVRRRILIAAAIACAVLLAPLPTRIACDCQLQPEVRRFVAAPFDSKWSRIAISLAGMYAELFVACLAALIWLNTSPGPIHQLCFNVMLMASVTTMLFNANPLMKFDGYYVLADLTSTTNLYELGQRSVRASLARWFLGAEANRTSPRWIWVYGVAATVWRISVCLSLLLLASMLFEGAGLLLSILAITAWSRPPLIRMWRFVRSGGLSSRVAVRLSAASAVVTVGVVLCWFMIPVPWGTTAPVVVRFETASVVRSDVAGFVDRVLVQNGQSVSAGETIAFLRNEQLQADFAEAALNVKKSTLRCRQLRRSNQIAQLQAELEKLKSLSERVVELRKQVAGLEVKAIAPGVVNGPTLNQLHGQYVKAGHELLAIGASDRKELLVSVSEDDVDCFSRHLGDSLRLRLATGQVAACRLESIEPAASIQPPDDSLSSEFGGPLLVRVGESQTEMLAPRFVATASLSAEFAETLRTGSTGVVSLIQSRPTIGEFVYGKASRWLHSLFERGERW